MRVIIVGGGIASVYTANKIKTLSPSTDVLILSNESYPPMTGYTCADLWTRVLL